MDSRPHRERLHCCLGLRRFQTTTRDQVAGGFFSADMGALAQLGDNLALGFGAALEPLNLLYGLIGVTLGTAIGVLPGIGPALTISMLMP